MKKILFLLMFPIIGFSQINISWNDDPGISYNGDTIFVTVNFVAGVTAW